MTTRADALKTGDWIICPISRQPERVISNAIRRRETLCRTDKHDHLFYRGQLIETRDA